MCAMFNHARIMRALEEAIAGKREDFARAFLAAYGTSQNTLRLLEMGGRNVADEPGAVALTGKIYIRFVASDFGLEAALDDLCGQPCFTRHKIRFALLLGPKQCLAFDSKFNEHELFDFAELPKKYDFFLPLTGRYEKAGAGGEHQADIRACEKMGRLHDGILRKNAIDNRHQLNVFLTRLLFCFFAEDTGIFPETRQMTKTLHSHTQTDGSDTAEFFERLFAVLDLPPDAPERAQYPLWLQNFPYVNGSLFSEKCSVPRFDYRMRNLLLQCGNLSWSQISPAIFGSMFQAVMDPKKRRGLGAHYTSEKNILRLLGPLFLDGLKEELRRLLALREGRTEALVAYLRKLSGLGFLDPACGCGNFLIIAYREIRELELIALEALAEEEAAPRQSAITIDHFHGIEIEEFPAQVARVSLWLMEHVMNLKFGHIFGRARPSIPLTTSAKIVCGDALEIDWAAVAPPKTISYIMGNPPFGGSTQIDRSRKAQARKALGEGAGKLDYVAAWYAGAAGFMRQNPKIETAFVSTNSICQGEQVAPLWQKLLADGLAINFAHQTFQWSNEARDNAAVYCVIVGLSHTARERKCLFCYHNVRGEPLRQECASISPYLLPGPPIIIKAARNALSAHVPMVYGNKPTDGGNLIIEAADLDDFLAREPLAAPYVKKLVGSEEFLHKKPRWCLWLVDAPEEILNLPLVAERIEGCRKMRLASVDAGCRRLAEKAHLFRDLCNPATALLVPTVSSERRRYIPMGFIDNATIATNLAHMVPDATLYEFAILTSGMHMAWMRIVCGRLKSDYRYSRDLCYNTFPWPAKKRTEELEQLAGEILVAREKYPDMTLAQLYDPEKMPEDLRMAHHKLDMAVDALYSKKNLEDDRDRLPLLFPLYEKLLKKTRNIKK